MHGTGSLETGSLYLFLPDSTSRQQTTPAHSLNSLSLVQVLEKASLPGPHFSEHGTGKKHGYATTPLPAHLPWPSATWHQLPSQG